MAQKIKKCSTCKKDTVHQDFKDEAISGGKVALALLTGGVSLIGGIKKGNGWYCLRCKTVN